MAYSRLEDNDLSDAEAPVSVLRTPARRLGRQTTSVAPAGNEYYSEKNLRRWIIATAFLHLGGFIAVIAFDKDQQVPLHKDYIIWPMKNAAVKKFTFGSDPAGKISMASLVAAFFLLSFLFQLATAINIKINSIQILLWTGYINKLTTQCINAYRWIEYSFSASCLFLLGALINGVTNLYTVLFIFSAMWTVMMLGLVQELVAFYLRKLEYANVAKRSAIEFFLPHLIGWVPYLFLWFAAIDSFKLDLKHSPSKPPNWVYLFYIVNFVIFSSFGGNQAVEMYRLFYLPASDDKGLRRIALQHEFVYVMLSLSAKSLSGYFLLSGLLASSSSAHY